MHEILNGLRDTGLAVPLEHDHIVKAPGVELCAVALYVEFEGEGADDVVDEAGIDGEPDGVDGGGAHGGEEDEVAVGGVGGVGGVVAGEVGELGEVLGVYEVVVEGYEELHARDHGLELEFDLNFVDGVDIGVGEFDDIGGFEQPCRHELVVIVGLVVAR